MRGLAPRSVAHASTRAGAASALRVAAAAWLALWLASASSAQQAAPEEPAAPAPGAEAGSADASPAPAADATTEPAWKLGPLEYRVARGLRFGDSGLTIGGFATVELERPDGEPAELALDSINFLAQFEPVDSFRVFAELEVGDLATWETSGGAVESDPRANFERLYAEYSHGDALNLRFGKFLTPVGQWNLAPAEPFVWTATQPAILELGIDEHQTGIALFGSLYPKKRRVSYWLYGQLIDAFDVESDETPAERSVGARLETSDARGEWTFGGSLLASELDGAWTTLGGLDTKWRGERLELSSELLVSGGDIPGRDYWGVFVEAAYPLDRLSPKLAKLYVVGRAEHFDARGADATQLVDFGLTWLPWEWLNVKLGYRAAIEDSTQLGDSLHFTLSVLF
jgi:hypothetical protein